MIGGVVEWVCSDREVSQVSGFSQAEHEAHALKPAARAPWQWHGGACRCANLPCPWTPEWSLNAKTRLALFLIGKHESRCLNKKPKQCFGFESAGG